MASAQAPSSPSAAAVAPMTFFGLPTEIRNLIYRFAIEKSTVCKPKLGGKRSPNLHKPGHILAVSKTFHREAAPFIYSKRHFDFTSPYDALCFILSIGQTYSALLTSIDLGVLSYTTNQTAALHWVLHCDFEDALQNTSTLLAQRCPQLALLTFSSDHYYWLALKPRIALLETFSVIRSAFPQLSNVSLVHDGAFLKFTVPEMARSEFDEIFDIAAEIHNLKEEVKAAEHAAKKKKAHAAKKAKKESQKALWATASSA